MPSIKYLNDDQIAKINDTSIEVLENTGVLIESSRARLLLKEAGAKVDEEKRIAKLDPSLVEEALKSAGRNITFYDRNGNVSVILKPGKTYYGTGSMAQYLLDPETTAGRNVTLDDAQKAAVLADALPNIDFYELLCVLPDRTRGAHGVAELEAALTNTTKPLVVKAYNPQSASNYIEMAKLVAGGAKELARKPSIAMHWEPGAALAHSWGLDSAIDAIREGIPMIYGPSTLWGVTSPASLAGTLVQANAEILTGLVVSQLAMKGSPFIYGTVGQLLNLKTTSTLYATPECIILNSMSTDMASHYGLPSYGLAGATDSKGADGQGVAEAMATIMMATLSGTNMLHGFGLMASGVAAAFEMAVIDNELVTFCRQLMVDATLDDESLALDVIREVGHGGSFYKHPHTRRQLRQRLQEGASIWRSSLIDHKRYQVWVREENKFLAQRARKEALKIIKTHRPQALPEDTRKKLSALVQKACGQRA